MKAESIYKLAETNGIELVATCSAISELQHDAYYSGTVKANYKLLCRIIKKHLPELYTELNLNLKNPWSDQSARKEGMLILVHSATDYFFSIK